MKFLKFPPFKLPSIEWTPLLKFNRENLWKNPGELFFSRIIFGPVVRAMDIGESLFGQDVGGLIMIVFWGVFMVGSMAGMKMAGLADGRAIENRANIERAKEIHDLAYRTGYNDAKREFEESVFSGNKSSHTSRVSVARSTSCLCMDCRLKREN